MLNFREHSSTAPVTSVHDGQNQVDFTSQSRRAVHSSDYPQAIAPNALKAIPKMSFAVTAFSARGTSNGNS